jgi:hypothetical protein
MRTLDFPEILLGLLTLAGFAWAAYHFRHPDPGK